MLQNPACPDLGKAGGVSIQVGMPRAGGRLEREASLLWKILEAGYVIKLGKGLGFQKWEPTDSWYRAHRRGG